MSEKLHTSEVWLRSQYVDQGKSIREMSEAANVSEATIRRSLKKFGIIN